MGAGYTDGCPKCQRMRHGFSAVGMHSPECRTRLEDHLRTTDRGQARVTAAQERQAPVIRAEGEPAAAPEPRHTLKRPRRRPEGEQPQQEVARVPNRPPEDSPRRGHRFHIPSCGSRCAADAERSRQLQLCPTAAARRRQWSTSTGYTHYAPSIIWIWRSHPSKG